MKVPSDENLLSPMSEDPENKIPALDSEFRLLVLSSLFPWIFSMFFSMDFFNLLLD